MCNEMVENDMMSVWDIILSIKENNNKMHESIEAVSGLCVNMEAATIQGTVIYVRLLLFSRPFLFSLPHHIHSHGQTFITHIDRRTNEKKPTKKLNNKTNKGPKYLLQANRA